MYLYTYYIVYVKGNVRIKKSFKTPDFSERGKKKSTLYGHRAS